MTEGSGDRLRSAHPSLQFLRYVVSGGVSASVDIAILAALIWVGAERVVATAVAFLGGAVFNYTMHRRFTFQTKQPASGRELFRYACVVAFNMVLTAGLVELLTGVLGVNLFVSKVATLPVVAGSGFVLSKAFVFRTQPTQ